MLLPLALMIASVAACCFSYADAKCSLTADLNRAMIALADENREMWTRQDTVEALQQMQLAACHKPLLCQADLHSANPALKENVYFTLEVVGMGNTASAPANFVIASDSIILMPRNNSDGLAIRVQGYADCSVASVFAASDQTLPGVLFVLSVLSMGSMVMFRKDNEVATPQMTIDGIKLTPMQRQLTQMLLDAPGMKVDKTALCVALWGNKSNAEESLYTLVRRTKAALAETGIEIACNRGESYELRINH